MDFQTISNMYMDYLIKGVAAILIISLILLTIWMIANDGFDDLLSILFVKYKGDECENMKYNKYQKLHRATHLVVTILIVVSIVLDIAYLLLSYRIIKVDGNITIILYNYGMYINLGFSIFTLCAIIINFIIYKKSKEDPK